MGQALRDWQDRIYQLRRPALAGTDKDGREIVFVSADDHHKLVELRITSFEMHHSAWKHPHGMDAYNIVKTRVREDI